MRTNLSARLACLAIIFFSATASFAQIDIDVTSLKTTNPDQVIDFRRPFNVKFLHNPKRADLRILIADDNGVPQVIKSGIADADTAAVSIAFTPSADGSAVIVKKANGADLRLTQSIQVTYDAKSFVIKHQNQAPPGPPAGDPPPNTEVVTGIELQDAILARKYYLEGSDLIYTLLGTLKQTTVFTEPAVREAWKNNPFIMDLLNSANFRITKNVQAPQGGLSSILSKVGSMDVTTVADGLARFLVKRTKEELTIAFFQHFRELINKDEYLDARLLFPQTTNVLNAIDDEIYQFENYISSLRESFEKDLGLLLDNMPTVIEEGRFKTYFNNNPNIKFSLLLTLFTGRELNNGTVPGKVIETLPDGYVDSLTDKNASGSIRTLQLFSASLRSRGAERYWTSLDSIQMLVKNDNDLIAAKFYLGFLYEKSGAVVFQNKSLKDYLNVVAANSANIKAYVNFVTQLGQECHNVQSAVNQVKQKQPETPSIEVYNRLFHAFADVLEQVNNVGTLPGITVDGRIKASVTKYLAIFRQSNDLALNIVRKNYSSAVINVYDIYLAATARKPQSSEEAFPDNAALYITDAKDNKTANQNVVTVSAFIRKYGNFMSNLVKAENSEQAAAAIEAAALPVGSATIKRHSNWNVSLNAYVGLFVGGEKIKNVDENFSPNTYGVTAPIGIAISKGFNWEKDYGWSASLFLSILDLGAPVAFRFDDDKTEKVPSIQLGDIVSPGVFLSIGFPKVPISMNLGWQSGPLLRKVNPQFNTTASSTYSRVSASFVVDIPLLNFHTSRNKN